MVYKPNPSSTNAVPLQNIRPSHTTPHHTKMHRTAPHRAQTLKQQLPYRPATKTDPTHLSLHHEHSSSARLCIYIPVSCGRQFVTFDILTLDMFIRCLSLSRERVRDDGSFLAVLLMMMSENGDDELGKQFGWDYEVIK